MSSARVAPSRRFDVASSIDTPETAAAFLDAALADGDPKLLMLALRDVLRSRVFQQVAAEAGVSRESLHRTLTSARDARLSTLVKVLRVIGCRLGVKEASRPIGKRSQARRSR